MGSVLTSIALGYYVIVQVGILAAVCGWIPVHAAWLAQILHNQLKASFLQPSVL